MSLKQASQYNQVAGSQLICYANNITVSKESTGGPIAGVWVELTVPVTFTIGCCPMMNGCLSA